MRPHRWVGGERTCNRKDEPVPFTVCMDTNLVRLAEAFAALYRSRPPGMHPLAPEYLIVQTAGMKRWLTFETARRCGSCAGVEMLTPVQFVMKLGVLLLKSHEERTIFERDILPWALYRILDAALAGGSGELAPLAAYCTQGGSESQLRVHALARTLADLFDQYMVSRPDWLALWERGKRIGSVQHDFPHRSEEGWQAHLWRLLLEQGGDTPSRAGYFRRLREAIASGTARARVPHRVSLFGMSLLPPGLLEIFAALGEHCDVTLFLQVPSVYYTGDLQSDTTLKRVAVHAGTAVSRGVGNRLLANLGGIGREFMDLVLEHEPQDVSAEGREESGDGCQPSLLKAVQRDVRLCENSREHPLEIAEEGWSIRFARCADPLREVEVLHDLVLESLRDCPGLTPTDILVVTPDLERYAPLVDMVFGTGSEQCGVDVRYSLADRSALAQDRLVRLGADLVRGVGERFSLAGVLALFEECRDCNAAPLSAQERDLVRRRCREAGIRWGVDGAFKERLGVAGGDALTWREGLDRMLAGFAVAGEEPLDTGLFPVDTAQLGEVLGELAQFVEALAQVAGLCGRSATCEQWCGRCRTLFAQVLTAWNEGSGEEPNDLARALDTLGERMEVAGLHEALISWELFSRELMEELDAVRDEGRFLTGALTVAGMVPMRSIPFRVIALLGMNRGSFPRHLTQPEYDLMRHERRRGDRDMLAADRYLFLELVLAAGERLILTAGGVTDKGEAAPASSVVEEFLGELDREYRVNGCGGGEQVTVRYPLHPCSVRYLSDAPGNRELRTFRYRWFGEGVEQSLVHLPAPLFAWRREEQDETVPAIIDGNVLCRALAGPREWFLRMACGVRERYSDDELPQTELFELDNLEAWQVRDLFRRVRLEPNPHAVDRFRAGGGVPPGAAGTYWLGVSDRSIASRVALARSFAPDASLTIRQYRVERNGALFVYRGEGLFTGERAVCVDAGRVNAKRLLRGWVLHLFENLSGPAGTVLICLNETVKLAPCGGDRAEALLRDLGALAAEAGTAFLPLFPDAAWAYCQEEDRENGLRAAWKKVEELLGRVYGREYAADPWMVRALGDAVSFQQAGIQEAFEHLSRRLFGPLVEAVQ